MKETNFSRRAFLQKSIVFAAGAPLGFQAVRAGGEIDPLLDNGVLAALGYKRLNDLGDNGSIWGESAPEFFVLKPANGQPASFANGGTVSFVAPSRAAVAAFHKAALAAGGKDEGAVGTRSWHPHAYAAYARDLDGNKIAAYCFKPE